MTFPSFITTGPTRDITVQPLEHKAFNLLPLIQLLQEDGKKAAATTSSTTKKTDDTKIEGRIGGVNQIMAEVNKADNIIKAGINLYGDAFTGTPEYARAVRNREFAMNPEVMNTLARETKNVDLFKEQIEGKGTFYHLGQFASTGELKRAKKWQEILEYGRSNDYYGFVNGEYKGEFDWTPQFNTMSDVATELNNLFKVGYLQTDTGWTEVVDKVVGNTVGVSTAYKELRSKRNFQALEGGPPMQLEEARSQALSRALSKGFDFTDPLVNGYFQSFLQKSSGQGDDPFKDYRDKKNDVTEENFEKFLTDFQTFVKEDIQSWYNKKKEQETGETSRESFVVDEVGTRALADEKAAQLAAQAWIGLDESHADLADFGMEAKWFEGGEGVEGFMQNVLSKTFGTGSGLEDLTDKDKEYLYAEPWSPFYKQSIDGKTYYNLNENINWETIKDNIVKDAVKRGIKDPEKHASNIIASARTATERFEQLRKDGKTFKATGRYDSQAQYMRADQVPDWFNNSVNSKYLIGNNTEAMGVGMFAKIGETYVMLSDIKGLKYAGSEGGIKMTANTVPTNLFTRVIENGQTKIYQWASTEWRKMSPEQKDKIIALSQEQSKTNPMYGTMLLDGSGRLDNTIKKSHAVPMDEYAQKALYALANEPGSTLNMIYASPGAYTTSGKFRAKTEADIAKAFNGVSIYAELPASYSNYNEADKKAYRKFYNDMWHYIDNRNFTNWSQKDKDNVVLTYMKSKLSASDYKEFENQYNNRPANIQHDWTKPGNMAQLGANFYIGKKLNFQNVQTYLQPVPVSEDGSTVSPIAKKQLTFTPYTEGTGANVDKGFQVNIDFDATGVTMKNVSDPALTKTVTGFHNESQRRYQTGRGWIKEENKNDPYRGVKPQK